MPSPLRIATRSSPLALWQARFVADSLRQIRPDHPVELVEVRTRGDEDRTQPLHQMGGVGVFTREVQRAVLEGRADVAVHSLKDLPTQNADGLTLAAVPQRASCYDVLVLPQASSVPSSAEQQQSAGDIRTLQTSAELAVDLPKGAIVGTGSLRRGAQMLYHRPDLQIQPIRGNVETRLRKLDEGQYQAVILAEAGLCRLDLQSRIAARLLPPLLFPAVGQGALGVECRTDDAATRNWLHLLDDPLTRAAVTAERALLAELRAGCHAPVGVFTAETSVGLQLHAVVLSPDGSQQLKGEGTVSADESGESKKESQTEGATQRYDTTRAEKNSAVFPDAPLVKAARELGRRVAQELLQRGAGKLIRPAG